MIPLCDLKQQYLSLKAEIDAAMQAVAAAGNYILGPNVKALEQEVAAFCGCDYGVGVGNGTDALHLALRALDIGPGDEVITTPFTFIATTEAIGLVGATPVLVDIDPFTFNIDPARIEPAITSRTKALLPVHLYGQPCDMDPIMAIARRYELYVVEDCAQAIGATYRGQPVGSFGDAGCLSFPSKNLGCFGNGGMVVSNNQQLATRIETLHPHGGRVKYQHDQLGLNSRLHELQAAILRVKLPHLASWISQRRQHAYAYNQLLADQANVRRPHELGSQGSVVPLLEPHQVAPTQHAVYHQYTVQIADRDRVARQLSAAGVGNAVYYPVPLHRQELHQRLGLAEGTFPSAERASQTCLSLPMFPELTREQQSRVVQAFSACWGGEEARRSG